MTRHIMDQGHGEDVKSRTMKFLEIDREATPSVASQSLQKRPKLLGSGRLREFMRIERCLKA